MIRILVSTENVISIQIRSINHIVTVVLGSMELLARSPFATQTRKNSQNNLTDIIFEVTIALRKSTFDNLIRAKRVNTVECV